MHNASGHAYPCFADKPMASEERVLGIALLVYMEPECPSCPLKLAKQVRALRSTIVSISGEFQVR